VLALALALAFRAANALLVVRTCFNPDEHWQCLPTASPSGNLAFPSPLLIVSRVFFFFLSERARNRGSACRSTRGNAMRIGHCLSWKI
jgi:hypothetical protein